MSAPEIAAEALRWLRYAREDLDVAVAFARDGDVPPRHACFWAQQAGEKALKAALVLDQIEFPFVHDLRDLRERVPDEWPLSVGPTELERLTDWGAHSRYPGAWDEPTAADAVQAVADARAVYESIAAEFARRGLVAE